MQLVQILALMVFGFWVFVIFLAYCIGLGYHGENASWAHWRVDLWLVNWFHRLACDHPIIDRVLDCFFEPDFDEDT